MLEFLSLEFRGEKLERLFLLLIVELFVEELFKLFVRPNSKRSNSLTILLKLKHKINIINHIQFNIIHLKTQAYPLVFATSIGVCCSRFLTFSALQFHLYKMIATSICPRAHDHICKYYIELK